MRFVFLFCGIFLGTIFEVELKGVPVIFAGFGFLISLGGGMYLYKLKKSNGVYFTFLLLGFFAFLFCLGDVNSREMDGKKYIEDKKGEAIEFIIIDKVKERGEYRIYLGRIKETRKKVYLYGLEDGFYPGEKISLPVMYKEPPAKRNFGDMDYKKYLNGKGIFIWLNAAGIPNKTGFDEYCLGALPVRIRNLFEAQIDRHMSGESATLSKAMLLGDTKLLSEDLTESFRNGGVSHVLSVSGLHVGYFYLLFSVLFKGIKKSGSRKIDFSILIPIGITFVYVIISGFQAPAVRSFLMFSIPKVGKSIFSSVKAEKKDYLAFTGILMLLTNPLLIYDVGFLISFSCIFAMREITFGLKKPLNPLIQMLVQSTSAWLGSLPFILWSFGRVSVAGLLSNIPVIPLSGICTIIGVLAMLTSLFSDVIGGLLFTITGWLMSLLISVTKGFATCFPIFIIPRLPFLVIGASTIGLYYKFSREKKSTFMKLTVGLIIFASLVQTILIAGTFGQMKIEFLDVGQGDSTIVSLPKGGKLLIDGGSDGDFLISTLNKMGLFKLDTFLITHSHNDHAAGAIKAIEAYRPKRVILPKTEVLGSSEGSWLEIRKLEKKLNFELVEVEDGDLLRIGGAELNILLPDGETQSKADENSEGIVFLLTYREFDCLFTADAGIEEEQVYCTALEGREIEILKIPHHGSKYSSGDLLIQQVKPLLGVVSVGRNLYGHPSANVLERYRNQGTKILRTDRCGAIRLCSNGKTFKIETVR